MHNSKMIQIFRSFHEEEHLRFAQFVQVSATEKVKKFHQYILPFAPSFDDPSLTKSYLFKCTYSQEAYKDGKVRYLMNRLTHWAEHFLILETMSQHQFLSQKLLKEAYQARGLPKLANECLKKMEKIQDENHIQNDYYYLTQHELSYFYAASSNKYNETPIQKFITESISHLDTFYFTRRLKLCSHLLNLQKVYGILIDEDLINELLLFIHRKPVTAIPVLAIYYYNLMMLKEPNISTHFDIYLELLDENLEQFPADEKQNLYFHALNYCAARIREGQLGYRKRTFKLYKQMLEKKLIGELNLSAQYYKNITVLGAKLGEYGWVNKFLNEYKRRLPSEQDEDLFKLCKAILYFYQKSYQPILSLLNDVQTQDVFFQASVRQLRIQTYYEIGEIEALLHLIDATRKYLSRITLAIQTKQAKLNFLKMVKQLTLAKSANQFPVKLRKEIDTLFPLEGKEWLLDKIYELMRLR